MRDTTIRLIGVGGLTAILYSWVLWVQFLLSLNNASPVGVVIGLIAVGFWFVGEVVLSLLLGAVSLAMIFTS